MYEIKKTDTFDAWLRGLKDLKAKITIARRIDRMQGGNFGDVKPVGEGVSEARVDLGPGYRLYYFIKGKTIVIVLHGGSKAHQQKDIDKAKALAKEFK